MDRIINRHNHRGVVGTLVHLFVHYHKNIVLYFIIIITNINIISLLKTFESFISIKIFFEAIYNTRFFYDCYRNDFWMITVTIIHSKFINGTRLFGKDLKLAIFYKTVEWLFYKTVTIFIN